MAIHFPYPWTAKKTDDRIDLSFWNLPGEQIGELTYRIGGEWTDATRPCKPNVLAKHPIGWNLTRCCYECWNGKVWLTLGGGSGSSSNRTVLTAVVTAIPAGLQAQQWVGIDPLGGLQLSSADDMTTEPIGVIGSKLNRATGLVIMAGEIGGYHGLTTGARVFLDTTPGGIVFDPDYSTFPTGLQYIQRVGTVKDGSTISVRLRKAIRIES